MTDHDTGGTSGEVGAGVGHDGEPPRAAADPPSPGPTAPTPAGGGADLAVSAAAYWAGNAVTLVGSLVRGKVAALVLGTSGLGVTSQLTTFSALVVSVAALGLGTGGLKLIASARARGDEDEIRRLVAFLLWLPTAAGALLLLPVILFARPLASVLLEDAGQANYLVLGALAIPLALLLSSIQLVMQAFERAYRLAVDSVIAAVLVTAAAVPMTVVWGLRGAVAAIPLSALATLLMFCVREPWVLRLAGRPRQLGVDARKALTVLAGASMAASVLALLTDTVLRARAVQLLGIDDIGLYQPVQVLSTVVLSQMAGVLSLVLLPRLSFQLGLDDRPEVLRTLTRASEASVIFIVPVLLLLMAFRDVFILVLFDSTFLGISAVLALQLVAELPRFAAYALGSALLPAGLVRPWLLSAVVSGVLRLATGLALLPSMGLYAFAVATVVQWLTVLVYTMWVLTTRMGWPLDRRLVRLLCLGLGVVGAGCLVSVGSPWGELALPFVALAWAWFLGRRETVQVLSAVVARVRSRRAAA